MKRLLLTLSIVLVITTLIQAHYKVEWLRQAPQSDGDENSQVFPWTNDCNGTSYQCGWLSGNSTGFGDQIAYGTDDHIQAFVVKYAPNGTEEWVVVLNSTGPSVCYGIVMVGDGVVFGGAFQGNVTEWNGADYSGNEDVRLGYVAKLFSDGSFGDFAIVGNVNSGDYSEVTGLETDGNGNLYIAGNFNGSLQFGTTEFTSNGGSDIFYFAYSAENGLFLFANFSGGSGNDVVADLATNEDGLSCLVGYFEGSATFGGITLTDSTGHDRGLFALGLDADGSVSWAQAVYGNILPTAVSINSVGHCTVVGVFNETIQPDSFLPTQVNNIGAFFIRFRSNGEIALIKTTNGEVEDVFNDVSCDDNNGDCFIAGSFTSNITFDQQTFHSSSPNPVALLLKVTIDGLWRDALVSSGNNTASVINVCNVHQHAYFGGQFDQEVQLGDFSLTSPSAQSFFYGKWKRIDDDENNE